MLSSKIGGKTRLFVIFRAQRSLIISHVFLPCHCLLTTLYLGVSPLSEVELNIPAHIVYLRLNTRYVRSYMLTMLRGENLNYNSCTNLLLRKSQNLLFLAPEVQWASKFTVFVRFTFPLNFSNHAHIWCVT